MKINEMPQTSDISKNGYLIYSDDGVDSQKSNVEDMINLVKGLYTESSRGDVEEDEAPELAEEIESWHADDDPLMIFCKDLGGNVNFSYDFVKWLLESDLGMERPQLITHSLTVEWTEGEFIVDGLDYGSAFPISTLGAEFPDVMAIQNHEIKNWPVYKYVKISFTNISSVIWEKMETTGDASGDEDYPKSSDYPTHEAWVEALEQWVEIRNAGPDIGYKYQMDGTYWYSTYVYPMDPETQTAEIHYNPKPQNPDGTWKYVISCWSSTTSEDEIRVDAEVITLIPTFYYTFIYHYQQVEGEDELDMGGSWLYPYANENIEQIYYKNTNKRKKVSINCGNFGEARNAAANAAKQFGFSNLADILMSDENAVFAYCDGARYCKSVNQIGGVAEWGSRMAPPGLPPEEPYPPNRMWYLVSDVREFEGWGGNIHLQVPDFFYYHIEYNVGSDPIGSVLPAVRLDQYGYYSFDYNFGNYPGATYFMNYALGMFDINSATFQYDAFGERGGIGSNDAPIMVQNDEGNAVGYEKFLQSLIETEGGITEVKLAGQDPYDIVSGRVTIPLLNQYNVVPRRSSGETYIGMLQSYYDTLQAKLRQGLNVFLYNDGTIETNQLVQDILFNDQSIVDPVTHIADVDSYTVGETIHECIPINSDSMDISMEVEYDPNTLKCTKVYTPNVSSGIKPADIVQAEPDIYVIDSTNVGNLYHTLDYVDIHAGEKALITFTACAFTGPDIVMIAYIDGGIALNPLPTGSLFTTGFTDYDIGVNRGICTRLKVVKVVEPDQDTRYNMRFIQNMTAAQMGTGEMNVFHTVNVKYLVNT